MCIAIFLKPEFSANLTEFVGYAGKYRYIVTPVFFVRVREILVYRSYRYGILVPPVSAKPKLRLRPCHSGPVYSGVLNPKRRVIEYLAILAALVGRENAEYRNCRDCAVLTAKHLRPRKENDRERHRIQLVLMLQLRFFFAEQASRGRGGG